MNQKRKSIYIRKVKRYVQKTQPIDIYSDQLTKLSIARRNPIYMYNCTGLLNKRIVTAIKLIVIKYYISGATVAEEW
jgi:hypothetical protein